MVGCARSVRDSSGTSSSREGDGAAPQARSGPRYPNLAETARVIVRLRQPRREVEMAGGRAAHAVLHDLGLSREGHLIIRNGTLVPSDTMLEDGDVIEIRPVISGG